MDDQSGQLVVIKEGERNGRGKGLMTLKVNPKDPQTLRKKVGTFCRGLETSWLVQ